MFEERLRSRVPVVNYVMVYEFDRKECGMNLSSFYYRTIVVSLEFAWVASPIEGAATATMLFAVRLIEARFLLTFGASPIEDATTSPILLHPKSIQVRVEFFFRSSPIEDAPFSQVVPL